MAVILGCAMQASLNEGSTLQEYDPDYEVFRQRFRQFQYKEAAGPREAFNKLSELCHQWLQPWKRSKEQILELLVLEQFLNILPTKIETWVRLYRPEKRERILSLIEDLEKELESPKKQAHKQETLSEKQEPVETAHIPPHIKLESSAIQDVEPSQDTTLAGEWLLQDEPQETTYSAAGEYQPFLEPEYPIPKPDVSFSLDLSKYLWEKELQNAKERQQLLDSKTGFDIGEEKEENTLKQKELEDKHSFVFTLEGNAVHDPTSQKDCEPVESQWEVPPDELHTDFTKVEDDQNRFLGEYSESSYMEEPLNLITPGENSPGENSHQCPLCGNCFAEKSQLTMHLIIHSREEPPKCPECGESVLCSSHLGSHQQLHTGETPDEGTTYRK